jgi:hypothetical protein
MKTLARLGAGVLLSAGTLLAAQAPRGSARLPNGLRVEVAEDPGRPVMRIRLRLPVPPSPPGLATFALEAMERSGTGSHSRQSFVRALDHAGLSLVRTLEGGEAVWELVGPPQAFDTGLTLLADLVLRPLVEGATVERARLRLFRELQALTPAQRALGRARSRLGAAETSAPDEAFLARTSLAELEGFLRDLLRPGQGSLRVEGAVAETQARTAILLAFGAWPAAEDRRPGPPTAPPPPRLLLAPGTVPQAWLGLDLREAPSHLRALLPLLLDHRRPPGTSLEVLPWGLALRTGGPPLEALAALQAEVDALAERGPDPVALEHALRRLRAEAATLGLHPGRHGEVPVGTGALAPEQVAAALRAHLEPRFRSAVLVGLEPLAARTLALPAFGPAEAWDEGAGTFLPRPAAAEFLRR